MSCRARTRSDADRAQHKIVQEAADRDQARGLAVMQLERVRSQMAEALVPLNTLFNRVDSCVAYMARELGFESIDILAHEFVRPFELWPHLEVWNRAIFGTPGHLKGMRGSPYQKFSPADIALLEDPAKRQN
jgi:hypothetical protein